MRQTERVFWRRLLSALLLITVFSGCGHGVSPTLFQRAQSEEGAGVLPAGTTEMGVGLLVPRQEDLGLSVPLRHGFSMGLQGSTNLAHFALGVPNAQIEWNFFHDPRADLSLSTGFVWLHPPNLYLLPERVTAPLGTVHILSVPTRLTASFPVMEAMVAHLRIHYRHASFVGQLESDSQNFSGGIGLREWAVEPVVGVNILEYAVLLLGMEIPLKSTVPGQAGGEFEVEEGVVVGIEGSAEQELDVKGLRTLTLSLDFYGSETSRVRFFATKGLRFLTSRNDAVLPGVEWNLQF